MWYDNTPSQIIQNKVLSTGAWKSAGNVHIYKSMNNEVATVELVRDAYHRSHKELHFPATNPLHNEMDIDLVIVPGMFFDHTCSRKGRGGGYYDKYLGLLNVCKQSYYIGLCFDKQVVEQLSDNSWDVKMDMVITETRTWCQEVSSSVP